MTYDGALVIPRNCVVMQEDEMVYVEAGWSNSIFRNNLKGLASRFSYAARMAGLTGSLIAACASYTYGYAVVHLGAPVISLASFAGPAVVLLIGLIAYTAITFLGNYRLFY